MSLYSSAEDATGVGCSLSSVFARCSVLHCWCGQPSSLGPWSKVLGFLQLPPFVSCPMDFFMGTPSVTAVLSKQWKMTDKMEVSIFGGLGTDTAPLLFLCAGNKSQGPARTQGEGDCVGSYRGEDPGYHKSQPPGGQLAGDECWLRSAGQLSPSGR